MSVIVLSWHMIVLWNLLWWCFFSPSISSLSSLNLFISLWGFAIWFWVPWKMVDLMLVCSRRKSHVLSKIDRMRTINLKMQCDYRFGQTKHIHDNSEWSLGDANDMGKQVDKHSDNGQVKTTSNSTIKLFDKSNIALNSCCFRPNMYHLASNAIRFVSCPVSLKEWDIEHLPGQKIPSNTLIRYLSVSLTSKRKKEIKSLRTHQPNPQSDNDDTLSLFKDTAPIKSTSKCTNY